MAPQAANRVLGCVRRALPAADRVVGAELLAEDALEKGLASQNATIVSVLGFIGIGE